MDTHESLVHLLFSSGWPRNK